MRQLSRSLWHLIVAGLRRHWLISVFVAAGVALRITAIVADRPAILYVDSVYFYLNHLPGSALPGTTWPSPDPLGYNMLLLQPVLTLGNLFTVVVIQHLLGIGTAILIYAVARRRGIRAWVAALAAAPLLLDAYQIYVEHMIMSDTLFEALLGAGLATLLWNRRPGPVAIAIGCALLGAATTVRVVGLPVLIAALIYLVITARGRGLKALAGVLAVLSFAVPVLGYQLYSVSITKQFGASGTTAKTLYARAATFVDCDTLDLPADERQLCPAEPLGQRHSPDFYANSLQSPAAHVSLPIGTTVAQLEKDFAMRAMTQQPLRLTGAVVTDAARLFTWNHDNLANPDAPAERFRFQRTFPLYPSAVTAAGSAYVDNEYGGGAPTQSDGAADFLRDYQLSVGYTPGPLLLLCLLAAIGAVVGLGRWRRAPNRGATFLMLGATILVIGAADFYEFSWRYQLPALVLLPLAGVLGASTIAYRPSRAAGADGPAEIVPAIAVPGELTPAEVTQPVRAVPAEVAPAEVAPAEVAPAKIAAAKIVAVGVTRDKIATVDQAASATMGSAATSFALLTPRQRRETGAAEVPREALAGSYDATAGNHTVPGDDTVPGGNGPSERSAIARHEGASGHDAARHLGASGHDAALHLGASGHDAARHGGLPGATQPAILELPGTTQPAILELPGTTPPGTRELPGRARLSGRTDPPGGARLSGKRRL